MHRPWRYILVLAPLLVPAAAAGQRASVSSQLNRALQTDTTVAVWLFGRDRVPVQQLSAMVEQIGGRLRRRSEWLRAVSADLSSAQLRSARARAEIRHIQPVARFLGERPAFEVSMTAPAIPFGAAPIDSSYGASAMPLRRLNLFPLAQLGYRGQGVKVALLDTGFETARSVFSTTVLLAQRDFVFNDAVVRNQPGDNPGAADHGTSTWSLLGANQSGTMIGIAADAQYILAKTEDVRSETRVEEDNLVAALEWADSLGAKVASISLGYLRFDNGFSYTSAQLNGDVAVTTIAADAAAQRGMIVVVSMGNSGSAAGSIETPADGDSVISVGATDSLGTLQGFSSRGPTADGRIKPDLVAPGAAVFLATPTGFTRSNGTSFSTPIIAGAAAVLKQIHPGLTPVEIRDALRNSASNARTPNSNQGWGTPDVTLAATFPKGITLLEPADSLVMTTTPRFAWAALDVPAFAQPVRYTLTVARDTTFATPLFDTTVTATELVSPRTLSPGSTFFVRLTARAADSATLRVQPATRYTVTGSGEPAPAITLLFQNFPNPFPNPATSQASTCIWFDIATGGTVRLDILDLRGHLVKNLVPGSAFGTMLPAGRYGRPTPTATTGCSPDFLWDGTTNNGSRVPQGIYLVRLETPDGLYFKRIVFLGSG